MCSVMMGVFIYQMRQSVQSGAQAVNGDTQNGAFTGRNKQSDAERCVGSCGRVALPHSPRQSVAVRDSAVRVLPAAAAAAAGSWG